MDLEQACVVLGVSFEEAEDFCAEVGADPRAITPVELVSMAALRDEDGEDGDFDEDDDLDVEDDEDGDD